jgi:signal transduction histidine kinase
VELDQILAHLADGARQSLQADAAAVRLRVEKDRRDATGAHLTVAGASGLSGAEAAIAFHQQGPISVADSPLDKEALFGRLAVVADARLDPRTVTVPKAYRSVLCVPLTHEDTPLGTLYVYATRPHFFCEDDAARLMPLAELGAAAVAAAMQRMANGIEVQVIDDGIGIPEESLPHLFQEFYRAPNAKASSEVGTGLGLAIVKGLVDRYGGRIEVESAVGQGAAFTVTFPLFEFHDDGGGYCRLPAYLERSV